MYMISSRKYAENRGKNRAFAISAAVHIIVLFLVVFVPGLGIRQFRIPEKVYNVNLVPDQKKQEAAKIIKELPKKKKIRKPVKKKTEKSPVEKKVRKKTKPKPKPGKKQTVKKTRPRKQEKSLQERLNERLKKEETKFKEPVVREKSAVKPRVRNYGTKTRIDAAAFPHQWYLSLIQNKVKLNWNEPSDILFSGRALEVTVGFIILKNGGITNVKIIKGSGNSRVDRSAIEALHATVLPPLPDSYKKQQLEVKMRFELSQ